MTHRRVLGGGSKEFCNVQGAGHDPFRDNLGVGWHHDEVTNIINLLVPTSLASVFLWSAIFIWGWGGGLLPVKTI